MRMVYLVHVLTGTRGVIAGYVALSSAKGALVHRKSGMLFVIALPMLVVLVAMFYWLWRVRIRQSLRGLVVVRAPEPLLKRS